MPLASLPHGVAVRIKLGDAGNNSALECQDHYDGEEGLLSCPLSDAATAE